jgi:hypothetical protein
VGHHRCLHACLLALLLAPGAGALATAPTARDQAGTSRPSREEKRCLAAERREQRHRDVIAEVDAKLATTTRARSVCTSKRACGKLDHDLKSQDARKQRYHRQLAQYQAETAAACARP